MNRLIVAAALTTLLLVAGCATDGDATTGASPSTATSAEQQLLARYGLDRMTTVEVIDHLDRLDIQQRPADLKVSVRAEHLEITGGEQEFALDLPDDRFYLSVAPYVNQTHECFYHSLTTCTGELAATEVQVRIVDDSEAVLVDQTLTTFANGFVGLWLPRGIDGTLYVSYGGKSGEARISTAGDAPTCLTTLRLT